MKKVFFLVVVILAGLISCKKNHSNEIILNGDFPLTINLVAEELGGIDLLCPEELIFIDDYLVIPNNCNNKLLQIVNLSNMQSGNFIDQGNGPSEFVSISFYGHKQGDSLLFRSTGYSAWINPGKFFKQNQPEISRIMEPIAPMTLSSSVFNFKWGWVRSDINDNNLLVYLDESGKVIKSVPHWPPISYPVDQEKAGYLYHSASSFNSFQKRIVTALNYFPYFFISDLKGETLTVRTRKKFNEPVIDKHGNPEKGTRNYYGRVETSDRFIYLYSTNLVTGSPESEAEPVVEIYDWNGDPVALVRFDRLVGHLDYDFNNGAVYGFSFCFDEERLMVVKAQVPEKFKDYFRN